MSRPDDSFYNLKKLHVVFALSSAALLAVTVWMLATDHWREWRIYQRTFQDKVEPWLTEAQLRQEENLASDGREPAAHRAAVDQLQRRLQGQTSNWGRTLLELPLIDALGRPLSIQQIWLPDLTINYNFRPVARYDRCTTCHVAMDKTQPGSTAEPVCRAQEVLTLKMSRPARKSENAQPTLTELYGFALAPQGIFDPKAPTVGLVLSRTAAAHAGLIVGDVLLSVEGQPVRDIAAAQERLVQAPIQSDGSAEDASIRLEVRRGLVQPYASHPRLDLYLGPDSPHPMAQFGCTICHDGQGSATEFRFASHTPNDSSQRRCWQQEYGWAWNRHWDFPMRARRFTQSSCLRCHHDVSELESSQQFPDPSAPKLVEGYHLVRRYGCFGCHEIKGVLESGRPIGPDMRLEPNDPKAAREPAAEQSHPGTMRKVGPSLRDVKGKLSAEFVQSWIACPSQFRPQTRMPQLFGMQEHLEKKGLDSAKRLEAVEIRAAAEYLLGVSQTVSPLEAPSEVTEPPSAERGKRLFLVKGCAACHQHEDYPDVASVQGPALVNLGSKIATQSGRKWLLSWIRDPARHSPRTLMPNALLEPIRLDTAEEAKGKLRMTDPAADIAAYLLKSDGRTPSERSALVERDLDELALMHLSKTYSEELAERYLAEGIPEAMAGEVQGDARELIGASDPQKKLRYVGRRTIRKRGCFGCHDIPGFEDAQPIGPALSEWGRKPTSLLAFGEVYAFLQKRAHGGSTEETRSISPAVRTPGSSPDIVRSMAGGRGETGPVAAQDDQTFYFDAIREQRREGFVWQKLRDPRSFDYRAAEKKTFNEQLLMGRFSLDDRQREAIATFVLGLVAEPPSARYLDRPEGRRKAIVEGRKVLDQYGCAECHTLALERWKFVFDPDKFGAPVETPEFAFTKPQIPAQAMATSRCTDRRGLGQAEGVGMPRVDAQGKLAEDEDENGHPLYFFTLWEPAAINGKVWAVGGADVPIAATQIVHKRAPWGGALARLLYPFLLREAKAAGMGAAEVEGWGWVPPPLVHEGAAISPSWLHDYLLNPVPVRPAVALRMPRYSLSTEEASKLVEYFASASGLESPYASGLSGSTASTTSTDATHLARRDQAMKLVTDRTTYCAKCHGIGDLNPGGDAQTILAPNLDRVGRRIQPEHLRRWLAKPKSVLPYTGMPMSFPPEGPPTGQELFQGTSLEQLDAVQELLLNYDAYLKQQISVRELIEAKKRP